MCHIVKLGNPYYIWYPFNLMHPESYEKQLKEKLGLTDPKVIQFYRDELLNAQQEASEWPPEFLETHTLRFDKHDWHFHLADRNDRSVTVYLERSLNIGSAKPVIPHPYGYAWVIIENCDTPETINEGLHCGDLKFAKALHKKLWKMLW